METEKKTCSSCNSQNTNKTVSPSSSVAYNLYQHLIQQFSKNTNVRIDLNNSKITIANLNEEQLLNLELFSTYYLNTIKLRMKLYKSELSVNNGPYHVFNQLNYLLLLALKSKYNINKITTFIKPFMGKKYSNRTININQTVDILTNLSLIYPTTAPTNKNYKLTFLLQ